MFLKDHFHSYIHVSDFHESEVFRNSPMSHTLQNRRYCGNSIPYSTDGGQNISWHIISPGLLSPFCYLCKISRLTKTLKTPAARSRFCVSRKTLNQRVSRLIREFSFHLLKSTRRIFYWELWIVPMMVRSCNYSKEKWLINYYKDRNGHICKQGLLIYPPGRFESIIYVIIYHYIIHAN